MPPKKTAPSRRRISFAVDREEIDISSDWVQAVMAAPAQTPFVAPVANSATDADLASVPNLATEESSATVKENAAVEQSVPVTRSSRRRPIQRITDGLTPGQYAVYSLMFEAGETLGAGESAGSTLDRVYRGGYADLCRLTGLSKRGIQNVVAGLRAKQVITIHRAPGYHRTETSAYRVPPAGAVVDSWRSRGWRFAVGKSKILTS